MSITQIIDAIDHLEPIDRKRLMTHLVLRRVRENETYRRELSRRLDDRTPEAWIPLDELKRRLGAP